MAHLTEKMENKTQCCRITDHSRNGYGIFGTTWINRLAIYCQTPFKISIWTLKHSSLLCSKWQSLSKKNRLRCIRERYHIIHCSILPRIGQIIMESISSLAINLFVMVFVYLYFMLIGGKNGGFM